MTSQESTVTISEYNVASVYVPDIVDVKKEQFIAMLRASETDPVKSSDVGPEMPGGSLWS